MIITKYSDSKANTAEYRIVENQNKYYIQIYERVHTGWLWRRREHYDWFTVDCNGAKADSITIGFDIQCDPIPHTYQTLDEAIEQIKLWKQPIKYYYLSKFIDDVGEQEVDCANN